MRGDEERIGFSSGIAVLGRGGFTVRAFLRLESFKTAVGDDGVAEPCWTGEVFVVDV